MEGVVIVPEVGAGSRQGGELNQTLSLNPRIADPLERLVRLQIEDQLQTCIDAGHQLER